jgi:AcrR family transcriptional regulator
LERNASFRFSVAERNDPFQWYREEMSDRSEAPALTVLAGLPALPGRKAQAARNDETILAAAREVFLADPKAPIAAVAERAGVGISALYRRYPSKDELLRKLCHDGLLRYIAEAEAADESDAGKAFRGFVERIVDADVHSLTVRLAGRFRPTVDHGTLAAESGVLAGRILARAQEAGVVRPDVTDEDLPMVYEQLTAVRLDDPARTAALRARYVELQLEGLRARSDASPLPGTAPTQDELGARWRYRG